MAIIILNKNRSAKMMEAALGVADGDKVNELFKKYRGVVFPEEKYDDLKYIKKARRIFKQLQGKEFYVKKI